MTAYEPSHRIEHDSLGEIEVPAEALWGAQTQRALANFPISGTGVPAPVIHALALIKGIAAQVNSDLGSLSEEQAAAIESAARSVAAGRHDDAFLIDVFQTGSGTSTNMNVNEVIAHLAAAGGVRVHPNDHVNAGQSSNDTFPSAIHIAAAIAVRRELLPALAELEKALGEKAVEFAEFVKAGRTHLMDATPVTLGQEFGGYAATLAIAQERLTSVLPRVQELPVGGTAVGTGINAPAGYAAAVIAGLMVAGLALFFQYTRIGRALRAVADSHKAALSVGISLNQIWVIVWFTAGIVALVTGIMWGARSDVSFGLSVIALKALPVLILGGFTSVPGAIVGGLIIGIGEKMGEFYWGPLVGGGIESWLAYIIALAFLLFRPQGLFGDKIIERI